MSLDICMLPGWATEHVALRGPTASFYSGLCSVTSSHICRGQGRDQTPVMVVHNIMKPSKQGVELSSAPATTLLAGANLKQGRATGRNEKDTWKEAVDSALTSLDNQSPRLDVYKKESISGEGALWLALISPSSPNQALSSLPPSQYDIDDSRRDEGHLHRWSALMRSFTCVTHFSLLQTFTSDQHAPSWIVLDWISFVSSLISFLQMCKLILTLVKPSYDGCSQ